MPLFQEGFNFYMAISNVYIYDLKGAVPYLRRKVIDLYYESFLHGNFLFSRSRVDAVRGWNLLSGGIHEHQLLAHHLAFQAFARKCPDVTGGHGLG